MAHLNLKTKKLDLLLFLDNSDISQINEETKTFNNSDLYKKIHKPINLKSFEKIYKILSEKNFMIGLKKLEKIPETPNQIFDYIQKRVNIQKKITRQLVPQLPNSLGQ